MKIIEEINMCRKRMFPKKYETSGKTVIMKYSKTYILTDILTIISGYINMDDLISMSNVNQLFFDACLYQLKKHFAALKLQRLYINTKYRENKLYAKLESISGRMNYRRAPYRNCCICGEYKLLLHYMYYDSRIRDSFFPEGDSYCVICFKQSIYYFYKTHNYLPRSRSDGCVFRYDFDKSLLTEEDLKISSKINIPKVYSVRIYKYLTLSIEKDSANIIEIMRSKNRSDNF